MIKEFFTHPSLAGSLVPSLNSEGGEVRLRTWSE